MNTALITLLLKPDKDPTHLSSYRPLSLINTDIKIISKALTNRIEKVIPSIIHPDQTGFIKGRQSSHNTRKLFNLMQLSNNKKSETIIIILSLDAQKAFDRVNWRFLFTTLQKFGFGESFINWIRALYTSPTATITTNGLISQQFTLHNGTRQGCPISPSLFAIFLEPLAASIRQDNNIKGIRSLSTEHKIILYADDVLILLQEPHSSLQKCLSVIKSFSSLSNYSINLSKSTVLPLCMDQRDVATLTSQFHLPVGNIKYLGIHISPKLSELFNLNFTPLLKSIQTNLNHWTNLPISLSERISTIKMSVLPQVNYLFMMIPTLPNPPWLNSLNTSISQFYWKNKTPRIKLSTLQKPKSQGGLEAPNFELYHRSSQLKHLKQWLTPSDLDSHWLETEQALCNNINLSDLPFISQTIKHNTCFQNISIASALTAWWKTVHIKGSTVAPSTRSPIWNNPDFTINRKPVNFTLWKDKGITHLHHIIQESKVIKFQHLIHTFGIGNNQYLHYLKLKSTILPKLTDTFNTQDQSTIIDDFLKISGCTKLLSKIYTFLNNTDTSISLPVLKWE